MDVRDEQAASALRTRALRATAALLALCLLGGLAFLLPWGEPVTFAQGVALHAVSVSEETSRSQPIEVKLTFVSSGPLSNDAKVFLHWSGTNGCQGAFDTAPAKPTRSWQAGETHTHTARLFLPASCAPGEPVSLFAGLYFPASGARLGVTAPESADDRVQIGTSHVVADDPVSDAVVLSGGDFARRALLAPYLSWLPWLAAFALVAAFLYVARGAYQSVDSEPRSEPSRLRLIARALPAVPFLLGLAMVLEFIKDDAYISFR
ncbi:MAG TPA: hypothetical protein VMF89_00045, partial [Polyangiales bacterium]|nr:hypothetical protein [Polyangiales bacterium]